MKTYFPEHLSSRTMALENCTVVSEFLIIGFSNLHSFKIPFFILLLFMYIIACLENLLIIALISTTFYLQTPMYIILKCMSLCELLHVTNLVPKMLHDILVQEAHITLIGCIVQLQFYGTIGNAMCYHYTLLSFDRYLAISKPLQYSMFIDNNFCLRLVLCSWVISFTTTFIISILTSELKFCGQNVIYHLHCDLSPLLALSYSDIKVVESVALLISVFVIFLPFIISTFSYIFIIYTIVKIPSATGRKKAFSTCSAHLFVVLIQFVIFLIVYVLPKNVTSAKDKTLSFVYIIGPPILNPIMYALRNQEIHRALKTKINHVKKSF